MPKIYNDGTYFDNNPSWHEEDSLWKATHVKNLIQQNSLSPRTICELGCGAGEILNQLSLKLDDGLKFTGYDISSQAYDLCKKKSKENLEFLLADLLDDNDAYFDIAMAIDVFEHVEDYFGFIRAFKEKAEYKIFHVPLDLSVQTILRSSPIMHVRKAVGHIHYFTKETAIETLKDLDYEIVDYFYTSGATELPNKSWKANLMKIPRKVAFSLNEDMAVRIMGGYSLMILAR